MKTERVATGDAQAFIFADKEQAVAVQIAAFRSFAEHRLVRLKLPAGRAGSDFTAIDMMGNDRPVPARNGELVLPLSREPVYLTCRGATAAESLRLAYQSAVPMPEK